MSEIKRHCIRGITICVDYDDLLAVTLPRNARHLEHILVVSAPHDKATAEVVAAVPNASLYVTDAFYRNGAKFNKGAAMEEGFDELGREGWILVHDADILFPEETMPLHDLNIGKLYACHRRMQIRLENFDPANWNTECTRRKSFKNFEGYFQLFHASDEAARSRPWYMSKWTHAGRSDTHFQYKWHRKNRIRLDFDVLHLGEPEVNWLGRASAKLGQAETVEGRERRALLKRMLDRRRMFNRGDPRRYVHEELE